MSLVLRAVLFDLHGVITQGGGQVARDGLFELVADLAQAGVTMVVGTAALHVTARTVLRDLGLEDSFAGIVGADDVRRAKPDPEVYTRALALSGAGARQAVVLDDSPHGIRAARAAGIVAVAVPLHGEWPPWSGIGLPHLKVDSLRELDAGRLDQLLRRVWGDG